jgi:hypothetical protein
MAALILPMARARLYIKKAKRSRQTYPGSSEYYYDDSSIWSPQHGYIMDAMACGNYYAEGTGRGNNGREDVWRR